MSRTNNHHKALREAASGNVLVRVASRLESGTVNGYVVGLGPELFVLSVVSDAILYDGFQALYYRDLEQIWTPAPHHAFVERALFLRGHKAPPPPQLDLASLQSLLRSAGGAFPLITVHRERVEPDCCRIGRLVVVSDDRVTLREMSPDATWDDDGGTYELADITRVDFGGSYEHALDLVNQNL